MLTAAVQKKLLIGGGIALLGLWWLRGKAFAKVLKPDGTDITGEPSDDHGGLDDPDSSVKVSQYVTKDGRCYRVAIYNNGATSSYEVDPRYCDGSPDL